MKVVLALAIVLSLGWGLAAAQVTPVSQGVLVSESRAQQEVAVLSRFGPDARSRLQAILGEARTAELPMEPLIERMSAGLTEGLGDSVIVAAVDETWRRLETASRALTHAGRLRPDPREITSGAEVLARGATSAQLESVIRTAAASRSLVVPLEILIKLADRGLPIDTALARVSGKLVVRSSDGEIRQLLGAIGG